MTVENAYTKVERANAEMDRLTSAPGGPGAAWRWSIPADPERDSDLIFAEALAQIPDLLSRLACVAEATYWDRPYDERIAAIRGMCDLATNGMTPACPHVSWAEEGDDDGGTGVWVCESCGLSSVSTDGTANSCSHLSATGVDAAPMGPGKVWRCDHCGLTYRDQGDGKQALALSIRPEGQR